MKASNLLPNRVKRVGWILLGPALILGVMVFYFEFQIPGFEVTLPFYKSFLSNQPFTNNLTDELVSIIVLITFVMLAFSEEKDEDEWISNIRLESLQWSVYANCILLVLCILLIYDVFFLQALVYNMYSILGLFLLRFNYVLHVKFNPARVKIYEK